MSVSNDEHKNRLLNMVQKKYPNYHPVIAMVKLAHTSQDENIQLSCHKAVARYVEPELKSLEVKGHVKHDHGVLRVIASSEKINDTTKSITDKSQDTTTIIEGSAVKEIEDAVEVE